MEESPEIHLAAFAAGFSDDDSFPAELLGEVVPVVRHRDELDAVGVQVHVWWLDGAGVSEVVLKAEA